MAVTLAGELGWGTLFVPNTALFHEYWHKQSDICSCVTHLHLCLLHTLLLGQSESEGICKLAGGETSSGQVKVLTKITSLKLGSIADLNFHKSHWPCCTCIKRYVGNHLSTIDYALLNSIQNVTSICELTLDSNVHNINGNHSKMMPQCSFAIS